jgi:hypothetical protein
MHSRYSSNPSRDASYDDLALRITKLGLLIHLIVPVLIVVAAYILRQQGMGVEPAARGDSYMFILFVLLAVALSEPIVAFFLRRLLLAPEKVRSLIGQRAALEALFVRTFLIVFCIGATPIVYGVVLLFLGGQITDVVGFALITLVSYRLLRPDAEFLVGVVKAASTPAATT